MYFFGYKCDECGKLKGEANHWWLYWLCVERETFELRRWDDVVANGDKFPIGHLCGSECVTRALAKFMQGGGEK